MRFDIALQLLTETFWTGLAVCMPVLGLTLIAGLIVSVLQVVTQIQEMSLTFVPKLIVAVLSLIVFGPWMLRKLSAMSIHLWSSIPLII